MSQQPQAGCGPVLARMFAPEIRAWRGDAGLATVFWFYGVLTSFALIGFYARIVYLHLLVLEQLLLIFLGFYSVWILISIWRCSLACDNVWGQLARFLTIAWAGNAILILFFRQIDLLTIFSGLSSGG